MSAEIDLGSGHTLRWVGWAPDDLPVNRQNFGIPDGEPMPVVEKVGVSISHPSKRTPGEGCSGMIHFDTPEVQRWHLAPTQHRWRVESWEPLTVSPSILCACGDHGFIRNGKWVPA